jgi:hypothetical protein
MGNTLKCFNSSALTLYVLFLTFGRLNAILNPRNGFSSSFNFDRVSKHIKRCLSRTSIIISWNILAFVFNFYNNKPFRKKNQLKTLFKYQVNSYSELTLQ